MKIHCGILNTTYKLMTPTLLSVGQNSPLKLRLTYPASYLTWFEQPSQIEVLISSKTDPAFSMLCPLSPALRTIHMLLYMSFHHTGADFMLYSDSTGWVCPQLPWLFMGQVWDGDSYTNSLDQDWVQSSDGYPWTHDPFCAGHCMFLLLWFLPEFQAFLLLRFPQHWGDGGTSLKVWVEVLMCFTRGLDTEHLYHLSLLPPA